MLESAKQKGQQEWGESNFEASECDRSLTKLKIIIRGALPIFYYYLKSFNAMNDKAPFSKQPYYFEKFCEYPHKDRKKLFFFLNFILELPSPPSETTNEKINL